MARPREAGGLAEASRLLQEGLQLLAEREREVDRLLEDARERALSIRAEAEARAAHITAGAEAQRSELEELVTTLRREVEALRKELADLRASTAPAAVALPSIAEREPPTTVEPEPAPEPAPTSGDGLVRQQAGEADAPRWGRPSGALSGQQAVRPSKVRRRRWLPPWLALLVILLVAAAIVATRLYA
jgi:vacuolar-type H+-ATPase subunit H